MNRLALGVLALASALGCASGRPQVNLYSLNAVPEEGGTRFTMITTVEDLLSGPAVERTPAGGLRVPTNNYFNVAPDGKSIVFLSRKNDQQNLFVKSTQGGVASTQRTFRDEVWDPTFSSDGTRLAFVDTRNSRTNVFEVGAMQGSAIRQITNFEQVSHLPAYSPAGGKLAFVQIERSVATTTANRGTARQAPGPNTEISRSYVWEVDLERNSFTQLAEGWQPAFSPDGKHLAVTRNSRDHGNSEIWVIDLASGTETVVATSKDQGYIQPSFSPDGKRLAFAGGTRADKTRPANWDVFVVDVDGSGLTQLTFHPGHDLMPRFDPYGSAVYFMSQRGSIEQPWNVWRMETGR
jgi:Tol biopolymer transport system component